jgi:hypothetical protein
VLKNAPPLNVAYANDIVDVIRTAGTSQVLRLADYLWHSLLEKGKLNYEKKEAVKKILSSMNKDLSFM